MERDMRSKWWVILAVLLVAACGGGGGGDGTPPTVVSTSPAAGATGAGTTAAVTATFSEPVKTSAVTAGTFTVASSGKKTAGSVAASGATASFTPAEGMCLFSEYTATVTSGITDLAGNALKSDYTWTFTTGDGTWDSSPVTVNTSTIAPAPVSSPHAGMDDSGNVIALWLEADAGGVGKVMANRSTAAGGWGAPVQIDSKTNTASSSGMGLPRVAVNESGNAVAVWKENNLLQDGVTTRLSIWSSRYTVATGQWSAAALLETNNDNDAFTPDVGIDSSGNAIAVWIYSVPGAFNPTYATIFSAAGATWSTPVDITTTGGVIDNSAAPKIAMNGSGKAIVAGSTEVSNVGFRVWAVRYDGTAWGGVVMIDGVVGAGGGQYGPTPQVAMNEAGDAFVVWSHQANGSAVQDVWANRYAAGTGWGTAQLLETDSTSNSVEPQIAAGKNGNAMATWRHDGGNPGNYGRIAVNRYAAGTGWGTYELIYSESSMHPQIVLDDSGNALAVWSDQGKAYAKRYLAGSDWGATLTTLETNSSYGYTENSPIAMNKSCGNAMAVWLGDRNNNFGIQSSRFR